MRTQFVRVIAMGTVTELALAACGRSTKSSSNATTAAPGTSAPAGGTCAPAPATTTTGGTAASSGPATVAITSNAKIGKSILVDATGMTLSSGTTTTGRARRVARARARRRGLPSTSAAHQLGAGLTTSMFLTVTGPFRRRTEEAV
jgi:hypothetical protein